MKKNKKHKDKRKKHSDGSIKKKHKVKKRRKKSSSDSDSSSSEGESTRRSVVTGRKLKLHRVDDEASRREEARREAIRERMNDGEGLGSAAADQKPMSSIERAMAEKLADKEGIHKLMLAKAEHAKFQLATGIGIDKPKPQKGGFFPDRGRTV